MSKTIATKYCPFCRLQVATDKHGRRLPHIYYYKSGKTECWGTEVTPDER